MMADDKWVALIDVDGMVHAAQWKNTIEASIGVLDAMIHDAITDVFADKYHIACKGAGNFRNMLSPRYKQHRNRNAELEKHLAALLGHAKQAWGAVPAYGFEADDLICSWRWYYEQQPGWTPIIIANDKDMLTVSGHHYNYRKKDYMLIGKEEAYYRFVLQLLEGDQTDGIQGIPGIGPKKAKAILAETQPEQYLKRIREEYANYYGKSGLTELQLTADLIYIRPHANSRFIV